MAQKTADRPGGGKNGLSGTGAALHGLMERLYPICRSITGDGVRQTLEILQEHIPVEIREVPSGTRVFDWTVPDEWNVRGAYIRDSAGRKVVDFADSNLHVVNYSIPVHRKMQLAELKKHLHTLPDHPHWIPYRTAYYNRTWGFCLPHALYERLADDTYEVCIDSDLKPGHLSYGELYLPGETEQEVLVSTHLCHPSLANDNLSGLALATFLARHVRSAGRRYSYRFLFVPATIGAITWLSLNRDRTDRISHGLVVACAGDPGGFTYKKSRRGTAEIDRIVSHVLRHQPTPHRIIDFFPYGYDERQYCSCGFDLPVGCFMRSPHGEYVQYHTSADDLDFVRPWCLEESFAVLVSVLEVVEQNRILLNRYPHCEPQLGKRNLYPREREQHLAILWVLNLADGRHSLLDIAERSNLPFHHIADAAGKLLAGGLLAEQDDLAVS